ncbi:MAG: peptide deformylase [Bacteroidales bacterium]|jgi:peptide deformylase|nr:peptide deformylase [Bacteroidales bacterium]
MVLPVYVYGWPLLRKKSEEITPDYPDLQRLIANMFDTMYKAEGVGLAAPQIGLSIRLIVIDGAAYAKDDDPNDDPLRTFKKVLINPVITARGGDEWTDSEGCLSLPKIRESVKRPYWIDINYCDEHFNAFSEHYEGIQARIIQHEYDHIEGAMFIDKISPIRRKLITGKLTAIIKGKVDCSYKIKVFKK